MKAAIKYFRLNLEKSEDLKMWAKLQKEHNFWRNEDQKQNMCEQKRMSQEYGDKIKALDGKTVEIDTKHLFANQFNTVCGLRMHPSYQWVFFNKKIISCYVVTLPKEYKTLLNNTLQCGYCGKQYHTNDLNHNDNYCNSCLGSEYLKTDQLYMLKLQAISDKTNRTEPTEPTEQFKAIKKVHKVLQKDFRLKKQAKRFASDLEKNKTERIDIIKQNEVFTILLKNYIDIENCIFYSHKKVFSFGWRSSLSMLQSETISAKIESIKELNNINFEFKTN